jgi:ferredoxin-type protein NapF
MALRSRREFLLGRSPRAHALARIGTACLDRQGIVCQACRDTCLTRAVRFLPLAGGISTPVVDESRCTGCGECLSVCPTHAITLEGITP